MHEKFNAPSLQLFANGAVCDFAGAKKMLCDEETLAAVFAENFRECMRRKIWNSSLNTMKTIIYSWCCVYSYLIYELSYILILSLYT